MEAMKKFQSTLPVWGATYPPQRFILYSMISIHAPRVGSDQGFRIGFLTKRNFNPRSPCGERLSIARGGKGIYQFQSTLPVWGATRCLPRPRRKHPRFQSTLPVWGATAKMHNFCWAPLAKGYKLIKRFPFLGNRRAEASGENSFSRPKIGANLPGIPCLLGLRSHRIRVSSGR